jgi:hypothetical protein
MRRSKGDSRKKGVGGKKQDVGQKGKAKKATSPSKTEKETPLSKAKCNSIANV